MVHLDVRKKGDRWSEDEKDLHRRGWRFLYHKVMGRPVRKIGNDATRISEQHDQLT